MSFLDRIFGRRTPPLPAATATPIEQRSPPEEVEGKPPATGTSPPNFTTEGLLKTLAQIHERHQNLSLADMAEVLVWVERKTNYSTALDIMLGAAAENQRVYYGDLKSAYMKCWWQWYEHRGDPHQRAEKLLVIAAYPEQFRPESKLEWYLIGHLVVWLRGGASDRSADLMKHFGDIPARDEIAAYQTAEIAQKLPALARPSNSYLNDDYKPQARTSMQDTPEHDTPIEAGAGLSQRAASQSQLTSAPDELVPKSHQKQKKRRVKGTTYPTWHNNFNPPASPRPPVAPAPLQTSREEAASASSLPGKATRLADQLSETLLGDIPADWNVFRSHNFTRQEIAAKVASGSNNLVLECLPFQILCPASWSIRLDPRQTSDRLWIRRIFVPPGSRDVSEGKEARTSPAFQLIATSSSSSTEEGVLDSWDGPEAGKGFQDYTVRESERITLNGTRMIARVFDFTRPSGRWRSLMTVRAAKGVFYYFDVSGLVDDVESLRSQLVPVLANVRLFKSVEAFLDACEKADGPAPTMLRTSQLHPPVEIVAPTGAVIDFRSAEEKAIQQQAASPLKIDDEQLARMLVALVQQGAEEHRAKRDDALAKTSVEIKEIGQYLYSRAGNQNMQRAYYRFTALGGNGRLLDLYWDGIGEWQG